jgi:hypothetical protein
MQKNRLDCFYSIRGILLASVIILGLQSCFGVKPTTSGPGKGLYQTFYVGEAGTQYFIRPLLFKGKEKKQDLKADFTFRYKDKITDSVIINFSLYSNEIIKVMDSFIIENSHKKFTITRVNLLFNERHHKAYHSRFTTKLPMGVFTDLFLINSWNISTFYNQKAVIYTASNRTERAIDKLNDRIFTLFR